MSAILRSILSLDHSPHSFRGRLALGTAPATDSSVFEQDVDDSSASPAESPPPAVSDELRTLLASLEDSVQEAEQMRRQSLGEFQQLAVELAVTVAGELVFRAIDADQNDAGGLVAAAVHQLGLDAPLTVWLHPQDIQLLESQRRDEPPIWRTGTLSLQADASLPRGHCRATNGVTVLLSEFAPRLEQIRDSLLEGLDDAQIERRRAAGIGSTLKRFPDRRETA